MNQDNKPSLLIIDSFALLFRGFFSTAVFGNYMKTSQGLYTNGLYQFTRYMLDAIEKFKPTHVVCAFDMGSKTFRNELYADYKANRDAPPEQLIPQFDALWPLVEAFDIPCLGIKGYEADDVIGSLAYLHSNQGLEVNILTGDGDTLQLINENTKVCLMKKGFGNYQTIDMHNLFEEKEMKFPAQVIELKALMGDASDNIPGCPNVGPKTAIKLLHEYETVDGVFANIDQIKGKLQERLIEHKEQIYLSRDLAKIRTDIVLDCPLDSCLYQIDRNKLLMKLEELEFNKIIKSFAG